MTDPTFWSQKLTHQFMAKLPMKMMPLKLAFLQWSKEVPHFLVGYFAV
jgi:hypothetical protein